jgi:hypothetical protein
MSADFEDFRPKAVDNAKDDSGEKHDPFEKERAFQPEDIKKAPDNTEKAAFKEGAGQSYSDWLAEHRTPQENAAALERSLIAAMEKMAKLSQVGMGDVVAGGSYLAKLVSDGPDEVRKFMTTVRDYIERN